PARLHQPHARREAELAEVGAVDRRQRPPDEGEGVGDAMLGLRRLVRLLRREADAPGHPVTEQPPQLVLGRHHRHRGAGARQPRQDGLGAQIFRVVHHDLDARLRIPEVVARDAVHRRWRAGHDREVVGVRERGHHAVADKRGAAGARRSEPGHRAALHRAVEIVGLAVFVIADGATHLAAVWTLWQPSAWLATVLKLTTALAAVAVALLLPPLVPKALALGAASALLDAAPDAIILIDASGTIRLVNERAERLFGYPRRELLGRPSTLVLPDDVRVARDARSEERRVGE